jgi:restriction system protein
MLPMATRTRKAKHRKPKEIPNTLGDKFVAALGVLVIGILFVQVLIGREWQYILALAITGGAIFWLYLQLVKHQSRYKLRQQHLEDLSPEAFEARVGVLLSDMGWTNVQQMGGAGDRGIDLRAERDGLTYVVQCKYYKDNKVPPDKVRDLLGTKTRQNADRAILVTTSDFTKQGREEARGHVELWNGETLLKLLTRVEEAQETPAAKSQRRYKVLLLLWGAFVISGGAWLFAFFSLGVLP